MAKVSDINSHFSNKDREMIGKLNEMAITSNVKLERVITDLRDLKDNFAGRISTVEIGKLDKVDAQSEFGKMRAEIIENGSNIKEELSIKYTVLQKDVEGLKDGNKWIIRLVIGAVLLAGLGVILIKQ